jgi:hypothetical protein
MQDNRNRFFLCTALHDTPVPFEKALGLRLGLKKGELRMASPEAMLEVLGVGPGCATPVATCNPSATRVILLLDRHLKEAPFLVHPMTNTKSVITTAEQLTALLSAHGRVGYYVDLSVTDFVIGKDSPPDLKEVAATVAEEKIKGQSQGVAAGTDSKKEKKAARCVPPLMCLPSSSSS